MRYTPADRQKSEDTRSLTREQAKRRAGIMVGGVLLFFAVAYAAYLIVVPLLPGDAGTALVLLVAFVGMPVAAITLLVFVIIAIFTIAGSSDEVSSLAPQTRSGISPAIGSSPASPTQRRSAVVAAAVLIVVLLVYLLSTGMVGGGGSGGGGGTLDTPQGLATDRFGNVYVLVNQGNAGCLARFKPDGTSEDSCVKVEAQAPFAAAPDGSTYAGERGFIVHRSIGGLRWDRWLAGDVSALAVGKDGSVYAVVGASIQVFSSHGALRRSWDISPTGDMEVELAVDQHGNVYVVTMGGNDVTAYTAAGRKRWLWHARPHLSWVATENYLGSGIAVDQHAAIYVTGDTSNVVTKLSPSGKVLSRWRIPDTTDQPNDMGEYGVDSVTADPAGNVYVSEPLRGEIVKFAANGTVVSTSFGT